MKKINIVKSSAEFTEIINRTKPQRFKGYLVFIERKTLDHYEFGISVSKKVGNAVVRNHIKRQFKSIIDKNNYQNNFKCIIIIKKDVLEKNYHDIEEELNDYFSKIDILEDENEKK
jgi:ribonuclease P protein component